MIADASHSAMQHHCSAFPQPIATYCKKHAEINGSNALSFIFFFLFFFCFLFFCFYLIFVSQICNGLFVWPHTLTLLTSNTINYFMKVSSSARKRVSRAFRWTLLPAFFRSHRHTSTHTHTQTQKETGERGMSLLPASSDATTVDTLRAILRQNPSFQVPVLNAVQAESMVACLDAAVLGSRAVDAIDVFLDEPKNVETLKAARLPEQLEQLLRSAKFCRQEHITTVTIKSIDNILLALGRGSQGIMRHPCCTFSHQQGRSFCRTLQGPLVSSVIRRIHCPLKAMHYREEMAANFEQLVSDDDSLQSVHRLKSYCNAAILSRYPWDLPFKSAGWKRLEDFAKRCPKSLRFLLRSGLGKETSLLATSWNEDVSPLQRVDTSMYSGHRLEETACEFRQTDAQLHSYETR